MGQELIDPAAHPRLRLAAEAAVGGELVVAQLTDPAGPGAGQHVGHVGGTEPPAQLGHRLQDLPPRFPRCPRLARSRPGRRRRPRSPPLVGLAEVGRPARGAGSTACWQNAYISPSLRSAPGGGSVPFGEHDRLPETVVAAAHQQQALGLEAVASGAAGLLLVVLERLRHAGVDDVAHVGAVDAHAEGDRGHHDVARAR